MRSQKHLRAKHLRITRFHMCAEKDVMNAYVQHSMLRIHTLYTTN